MKMRFAKRLANPAATPIILALLCAALAASLSASFPKAYQATPPAVSGTQDLDEQRGPFAIGDQSYTVVLHFKRPSAPSDPLFAQTLASLEIRDAAGAAVYEKSFPFALAAGRFQQNLSASVERLSGNTGAGLAIHYTEQTAASQAAQPQAGEFWQLFGLVNGKFAPLPKPATIGEANPGGPYMGVIMRAANGAVSVVSQPDTIEIRAWTGNFYIFVPLRVDWNHGGLAQGQRCVERLAGPLQDVGCPMRAEANRKPSAEEYGFLRLFTEAHENFGNAEHVVLQKDSKVAILGSSAITSWNATESGLQPVFSDVWLHVRIDNREGWIHGEEDLAAVGLPAGSPVP